MDPTDLADQSNLALSSNGVPSNGVQSLRTAMLLDLSVDIGSRRTRKELIERVMETARVLFDFDRCTLNLLHGELLQTEVLAEKRPDFSQKSLQSMAPQHGIAGAACRTEKTQIAVGTEAIAKFGDPADTAMEASDITSILALPLCAHGEVFGALLFGSRRRSYSKSLVNNAQILAGQLAGALTRIEQLVRLTELSERLLAENTQRRRAEAELSRANEELERFAYIVSHDLRAPLRALINLSKWIQSDVQAGNYSETSENATMLVERAKRMRALLDGLLEYSRAGRLRAEAESVDLREVIEDIRQLLEVPKGFEVRIEGKLPTIHTARAPLEMILRNLISNGLKHHGGESGCVTVRCRDKRDGQLIFEVQDDGRGIAPEHHERIFQVFSTLRPQDETDSTGVGLSVAKRIVQTAGGDMTVESAERSGATFRFTWPTQWGMGSGEHSVISPLRTK